MNFGALRVVNDDLVTAREGFGAHPHRDMEIFSYIVDGELTHADSKGNRESLGRGAVQYMSAGMTAFHDMCISCLLRVIVLPRILLC
jgi:quercetin 2,3-dioxygenase